MHWDRTVARILLIFSVTNIALAAPAAVRPTHTGVAEAASEKRFSDDEATDGSASEPMPELVSDSDSSRYLSVSTDSGSNRYFSASESLDDSSPSGSLNDDLSPSGSSHDDWPPASPAASFREGPGVYQIFTFQGANWQYDSQSELDHDSAPESPDGSSHASHPDPARASPAVSLNQDSADSAPESPPSGLLHQDSVPGSPLHDAFFNDALKKKLMIYAGLGTIVGASVGLTIGVHKLIKDTHSHGVETAGRDLASSDFVIRDLGTSVLDFPDHPLPRKDRVSRGIANLRGEDSGLLDVLTRKALSGFDKAKGL